MKALIWFLFVAYLGLKGVQAESSTWQKARRAKSVAEISSIKEERLRRLSSKVACEWELREERVPIHCFSAGNTARQNKNFTQICRQQAIKMKSEQEIMSALATKTISKGCEKALVSQLAVVRYQNQDL